MHMFNLFSATAGGQSVFSEIALIIAIGLVVALIMRLLKQPLIIGHIITGVLVGPSVFNLIQAEETINVFANLGIALLLFIIGLGLNPRVIKEVGSAAVIAGTGQIALTTAFGYILARSMGFESSVAGIIGIALAFSSTIIILKLISDKREQTRLYAKLSVGVLLVQDIVATIALLMLAANEDGGADLSNLSGLALKTVGAVIVLAIMGTYVLPRFKDVIAGSQEFLFLFALGWGLGIAALFQAMGLSIEVGALFAGVGLATQAYTQEVSARLRPLRDFFVVVFFILLGSGLVIESFNTIIFQALALSALVIILNPIIIVFCLGALGFTKKISFKVGIGFAQISEFSLVFAILAERQGRIDQDTLSMLTLVALITIAASTYMILYDEKLYPLFEKYLTLFERKKTKYEQENARPYPIILFGFKKGGLEFSKVFKQMKKQFVVVDYDPEIMDVLDNRQISHVYGDANDIELLDEIGIEKAKLIVSTITDHKTNVFLATHVHSINPEAVVICHSDTPEDAQDLYSHGASYVVVTHSIGSEKVGTFLKKNGFSKKEFKRFREKHLETITQAIADAQV